MGIGVRVLRSEGEEMMSEKAFFKLSEHLSAGFVADNVIIAIFKFKHKVSLDSAEIDLLTSIRELFERLAEFSDSDDLAIAIEAPLRYAADSYKFGGSLRSRIKARDVKNARRVSEALSDVLEGREDTDLGYLEDYFTRISDAAFEPVEEVI